ncbi:bifunctional 2-C-methyl-D-erythritol 4-phosphate cytidylyltransferase/2-C-methyl-D-erythritol 2,4-cyclodiphosphate synthase [Chelatococcus reniformis]|uniref:Bifunctional enzyme IspD/IspF n=1 Tax=Chelatococcus reniformis TaxID=1494448 RepID=A0A916X9V0_9HYPH|nr:bifunctional 2-C-methyl-D-erythritol 4-phosphate cytidylyltransferase/2-C-methyl-D-erythritol 2,4-cyclodiphosphate synthase [Chelatococcus reniformis]GGC55749.1 bifunctional enzyme IspD/IspF [Chelatococcus reniformis]
MTVVAAILVAAGRGNRAGPGRPKQYRDLHGRPVLWHGLSALLAAPRVAHVVVVIHPDDRSAYDDAIALLDVAHAAKLEPPVDGGETRQASVRAGLEALAALPAPDIDVVLIHDAARPFASVELIDRAIDAAVTHGAALPTVAVADTIKRVDGDGRVLETYDRAQLHAAQTPQAFRFGAIAEAHRRAAGVAGTFTDDAAIAEWAGIPVFTFAGDLRNVKLTTPADFAHDGRPAPGLIGRTGFGYDVHAFGDGDHLIVGGVRIAHDRGVLAHSDGDVVLHALTDALLGTIADGDIGTHFPPSDPQWRGASSDRFLAYAAERIRARGGIIDHLDVTVVCERPRIGPHRDAMRERIAAIAGVRPGAVSIKATTSEGLGFTGRREGIAAQAAASVRLPATTDLDEEG